MRTNNDTIRRLLLGSLPLLVGACIPAPYGTYYKPFYPDASAVYAGASCGGQAGPPSKLTFSVADGVALTVSASHAPGAANSPGDRVQISLAIPNGAQVAFSADEVRVGTTPDDQGSPVRPQMRVIASRSVPASEGFAFEQYAPIARSNLTAGMARSASTQLNFSWQDGFAPRRLSMHLPAIRVEDEPRHELPPLTLTADAYPYGRSARSLTYRTPDYQAEVTRRYAECLAAGRSRQCDSIPAFDSDGFRFEREGFALAGRWYVFDPAAKSPFNGELRIVFDPARKWRFVSNEVEVRDVATSESRTYRFDRFRVHVRYHAPFGSAVTGVNAPEESPTLAELEVAIPSGRPSAVYIRLPPVVVNQREYALEPLKLELRKFEFGLEPFNC